eukprot:gb/GEZN01013171.1/.p1 GENE.gb/GEZN01013171.1/~~gb/GEZN01013171.1/.p1  ORF type:complete len:186 (+),score=28.55 gb/GEZN01013171.1/:127-684(+)
MAKKTETAEFTFPEFYSFPPFWTLQPVLATRAKQADMWVQFVINYTKHHKKSEINLHEDLKTPLFSNPELKRTLSLDTARWVLDVLCQAGYGTWQDEKHTRCGVSWRKFDEWGNAIYKWAQTSGLVGSICTLYEIQAGDVAAGTEFFGLPLEVLLTALRILEKEGRCTLVPGDNLSETGVKFLEK